MAKQESVIELEAKLDRLITQLVDIDISSEQWSRLISKYNALDIKLCHMKGEPVGLAYYTSQYII